MSGAAIRSLHELVDIPRADDFDGLVEDVVALWLDGQLSYHECAEQLRRLSDRRNQLRRMH